LGTVSFSSVFTWNRRNLSYVACASATRVPLALTQFSLMSCGTHNPSPGSRR
jgi:hypothetical protein